MVILLIAGKYSTKAYGSPWQLGMQQLLLTDD